MMCCCWWWGNDDGVMHVTNVYLVRGNNHVEANMPESPSCTEDVKKRRSSRSRRSSRRTSFSLQTFKDDTGSEISSKRFRKGKGGRGRSKSKSEDPNPSSLHTNERRYSGADIDSSSNGLSQQLLVGLEDTQEAQDNLSYEGSETWFSVKPFMPRDCRSISPYTKFVVSTVAVVILLLFFVFSNLLLTSVAGVDKKPQVIPCYAKAWLGKAVCGVNGEYCRPFKTETWQAIRCPGRCGPHGLEAKSNIVGSGPYRSDSWLCQAAIHRGALSNRGGCALWKMTGSKVQFDSSDKNSIVSKESPYWFPSSFDIKAVETSSFCFDDSFNYFVMSIMFIHSTLLYWFFPKFVSVNVRFSLPVFYSIVYLGLVDQRVNKSFEYKLNRALNEAIVSLPILYLMYIMNKDYAFVSKNADDPTRCMRK